MKAKPEQMLIKKNILRLVLFSSLLPSFFDGILVPIVACCTRLTNFWTSSPPTSCQRLGLCPSRSWWSWLTSGRTNKKRAVGHEHVNVKKWNIYHHQLIKIKFTFRRSFKRQQRCWLRGGRRRRLQRVRPRDGFKQHQGEVQSSGLSHWHCTQDDLEPMISQDRM